MTVWGSRWGCIPGLGEGLYDIWLWGVKVSPGLHLPPGMGERRQGSGPKRPGGKHIPRLAAGWEGREAQGAVGEPHFIRTVASGTGAQAGGQAMGQDTRALS